MQGVFSLLGDRVLGSWTGDGVLGLVLDCLHGILFFAS